jgi:hypothetical protein
LIRGHIFGLATEDLVGEKKETERSKVRKAGVSYASVFLL